MTLKLVTEQFSKVLSFMVALSILSSIIKLYQTWLISTPSIGLIFTNQSNLVMGYGVHPSWYPNCHHQIILAKFNLRIFYLFPYEREIWHYQKVKADPIPPFLFHKNSFYKSHEAENRPKIKNFVRITPGSRSRDL